MAREKRAPAPRPKAPEPLPRMTRGALALAVAVAALCACAAVTYRMYDADIWQHLTVGREIWRTHSIPHTQLWSWPTHGAPDVLPSWLFRVLLWPFWNAGGLLGLFAWRWLTTLAAFALLWLAARRAGATGALPLLALVWCALLWRQRSQVRPETLVAVLLAAELLLLETRRAWLADPSRAVAARRLAWALVPIAWAWANAHVSYYLALVIAGGYLLDDLLRAGRRRERGAGVLLAAIVAAAAACFVNPFGWRALWQPFEYFLVWRHEPVFRTIGELQPLDWTLNVRNGLPAFFALYALAFVARLRRRGPDWAEIAVLAVAVPQALASQRFLGYLAVMAAPFFARDLGELAAGERWPAAVRAPLRRAALVSLACVALCVPELTRPYMSLGYGMDMSGYPVRAADWIAAHDVRGRAFNPFSYGPYLLWRFYPDSTRLPFMEAHQAGTREIRYLYAYALEDSAAWRVLDDRYRIDWALLRPGTGATTRLLDYLDADPGWALVFSDDAGALYLRRGGADSAQAARFAFRRLPGGDRALVALGETVARDTAARSELRADLERAVAASEWNGRALSLLANVDLSEARWADAARHLEAARAAKDDIGRVSERLGLAKLFGGDPAGALAAFEREARENPKWRDAPLRRAQALQALGRLAEARASYEVARDGGSAEARDSLEAMGRR